MKRKCALTLAVGVLAGCASAALDKTTHSYTPEQMARVPDVSRPPAPAAAARALTLESYKEVLARHISHANAVHVYGGRPQAMLRSVIVLRFVIDAGGHLVRSEIVRTNHDKATEATALASLHNASPFPEPSARLLARGRMEISETWLFNNDGRFQLRSIAAEQMNDLR